VNKELTKGINAIILIDFTKRSFRRQTGFLLIPRTSFSKSLTALQLAKQRATLF